MSAGPSIRQVARHARVSVATISRVVNSKGAVRETTRAKVLAAVAELGYVPHNAARSLSTRRTMSIGVVLPDLHGEFFSELIRGIDRAARRHGYHVLVSGSHSDSVEMRAVLAALHGRVDGLVLMNPAAHGEIPEMPDRSVRRTPTIVLNAPPLSTPHDSIRVDNRGGARAAVEHLLFLGHRAIATITGPDGNSDAADRTLGYREALAARGVATDPAWVLGGGFDEESGYRAGAAFARLTPRPTAIFAANDAMAIGCLAALSEHGLDVPIDVSLAGFDDVPMARYVSPGLTSVRVAIADLGERAVERLLGAIRDGAERMRHHEVVAATLVPRGSTAPCPSNEASPTQSRERKRK